MNAPVSSLGNHGSFRLPWFTLFLGTGLASSYVIFGPLPEALVWHRTEIEGGALWRYATGHFVHTDIDHLIWNAGAYLVLGGILESIFRLDVRRQTVVIMISAVVIGAALHWPRPDLIWYAGFSGVLNAYFVLLLWAIWRRYRRPATIVAAVGMAAKIAVEGVVGDSLVGAGTFAVVPEAHAAGAIAGIVVIVFSNLSAAEVGRSPFLFPHQTGSMGRVWNLVVGGGMRDLVANDRRFVLGLLCDRHHRRFSSGGPTSDRVDNTDRQKRATEFADADGREKVFP